MSSNAFSISYFTHVRSERETLWKEYREEIISHAGIAIFIFGNKLDSGSTVIADGVLDEFKIAKQQGLAPIPVGATASAAKDLAVKMAAAPDDYQHIFGTVGLAGVASLADPVNDLTKLISPIVELVRRLQGKIS